VTEKTIIGVSYYVFPEEHKAIDAHARALVRDLGGTGAKSPQAVLKVLASDETPGAYSRSQGLLWEKRRCAVWVYYYDDTALLIGLRPRTTKTPSSWKKCFTAGTGGLPPYKCAFIEVIETSGNPDAAKLKAALRQAQVRAPRSPAGASGEVRGGDFWWQLCGPNDYQVIGRRENYWLHKWCFSYAYLFRLVLFHGKADRYRQELEQASALAVLASGLTRRGTQACKQKQQNIELALKNFDAEWDRASLGRQTDSSLGQFFLGSHKAWRDEGQRHLQKIVKISKGPEKSARAAITRDLHGRSKHKYKLMAEALLSAFGGNGRLEWLAKTGLDLDLSRITSPNVGLEKQVMDLMQWAENQGKIEDLLRAALIEAPLNPQLQEAKEAILGPD
jgi:hypothetical protein